MKLLRFCLLIIITFCLLQNGTARDKKEKDKIKFGEPNVEDLEMVLYDQDSSAVAVILSDIGSTNFLWNQFYGFQIHFKRHLRIKILDKSGLSYANRKVFLYRSQGSKESISGLKGYTYNLRRGRIKKEKLDKNAIFEEQLSDNWTVVSFALPNVRVGSVVDIEYIIHSDFLFNLREWDFQHEIPTRYSEYNVAIPEYFDYKNLFKGYEQVTLVEKKVLPGTISITTKAESDTSRFMNLRSSYEHHKIDYKQDYYKWISENVPAYEEEPFVSNINNYITSLEFELASYRYPESLRKNLTNSWETIRLKLIENEYFGGIIGRSNLFNAETSLIASTSDSDFKKMITAFEYAKEKVKWNNKERLFAKNTIKKIVNEGVGNSADVNLFLVSILRELGLDANPVILSTRKNGILHPGQIMLSKYNYVIASVVVDNKRYMLDATETKCPYYMLPERCINGFGMLINENYTEQIDLNAPQPHLYTSLLNLSLNEGNKLIGNMQNSRDNYAALDFRKDMELDEDHEKLIRQLEADFEGLKIVNYDIKNIDSIYKPIQDSYEITVENKIDILGDMIYLNPLLYDRIEENPFKEENRKFPVDYIYPRHRKYLLNFAIPPDYNIEELPSSTHLSLPDNAAEFTYNVKASENTIQFVSEFKINRSIFPGDEYKGLKEFYEKVVAKQSEQIVLKKRMNE